MVMDKQKAIPPRQLKRQHVNISDLLQTCTYVLVRHDAIRKPLPMVVLTCNKKYFTVNVKRCKEVISIDRLKPAYLDFTTVIETKLLPHPLHCLKDRHFLHCRVIIQLPVLATKYYGLLILLIIGEVL